jgi:hypothetical protein
MKAKSRRESRVPSSRLEKMIDEAIVDCYNESEQAMGLFTMIEESLSFPFPITIFGVQVMVEAVRLNDAGEVVAVCTRGRERQNIPIVDLPLPTPRPEGAEWIEAYRRWARGR